VIFQPTTHTFSDQQTFAYDRESASITGTYDVNDGLGFDGGAMARVWRGVGMGASVTRVGRDSSAAYEAQYPHPFFFSRPRTATVDLDDLKRTELGLHLSVAYVAPQWRSLDVTLFGGPTIFSVQQDLAGDLTPVEVYPYDTITVTAGAPTRVKETVVGFHAGGGLTWFFTRNIGLGGQVRFTSGSTKVPLGGNDVELKVGGVQAGIGVRVRF
jgi:opacity protein-like surface antigen